MTLYLSLFLGFAGVAFIYAFLSEPYHRGDPKARMIEGFLFYFYRYIGIAGLGLLCVNYMLALPWLTAIWQVLLMPAAFFIGVYLGDVVSYPVRKLISKDKH